MLIYETIEFISSFICIYSTRIKTSNSPGGLRCSMHVSKYGDVSLAAHFVEGNEQTRRGEECNQRLVLLQTKRFRSVRTNNSRSSFPNRELASRVILI